MIAWLLILSSAPLVTSKGPLLNDSTSFQKVEVVEVQTVDLSNEDWSEWSECSDTCGGCGIQNRSASLANNTQVVHVRHCNMTPCDDDDGQCCEPFMLQNGRCMRLRTVQGSAPTFSLIQNDTNGLAFAWNETIPGTSPLLHTTGADDINETDLASLLGIPSNESDSVSVNSNVSKITASSGIDDGISSAESDGNGIGVSGLEVARETFGTDIQHDPKQKRGKRRRGSNRGHHHGNYKRKQRRRHHDVAKVANETVNITNADPPQKKFDAFYVPEYYDSIEYYYYYY